VKTLTPRQIVQELDRYVVGQNAAKRAVAIAVRNRWRRQQLPEDIREDVLPKNIMMIGPTGVGKTEIARRLAHLVDAPFLKIEATKFTEVGYVGRDIESIVRDLVEISMNMVRDEQLVSVREQAAVNAEERLLDALMARPDGETTPPTGQPEMDEERERRLRETREKLRKLLRDGKFEGRPVEITVEQRQTPTVEVISSSGIEQMGFDFQNMFDRMLPSKRKQKKLTVAEARTLLTEVEADKLLDKEKVTRDALWRAENMGIVFLDEIDKVAIPQTKGGGPDVSRGGVQRDLLPLVEGCAIVTRYGVVRTDHILFIAAGAFHSSKPSDLIPELQGRFPIRVELEDLGADEFLRILTEPKNALTKQYASLLLTEEVKIDFKSEATEEISKIAVDANMRMQNIGARRLQTIMERLLEDISFDAPDMGKKKITIDGEYVRDKLKDIIDDEDLSRYML